MSKREDLCIQQGKTFVRVIRWETAPLIWKPITAIAKSGPVSITAVGHGVPDGWRVGVCNVQGMLDINAEHTPPRDNEMRPATVASVDVIQLNEVSSADFDAYTSGGYVVYWTPHDLVGYTARMKIKDRVGGTVLYTVTGLVVDTTAKTITLTIPAADTTLYTFLKGVYDLELVSPGGAVTAILTGTVKVQLEVTT